MLNSNKKINVKILQSVQRKLLAVVEKLETSEEAANSLDWKEGDHDHEGSTGGEKEEVLPMVGSSCLVMDEEFGCRAEIVKHSSDKMVL